MTTDDRELTTDERQRFVTSGPHSLVLTRLHRLWSVVSGRWSLPVLLLLALAFRLLLWSQPLHQLANDELEYVPVARDLLAGHGWVFYERYEWLRAPLYPLFLAGSLWLANGDLHRAALPNIALSVANVYLVYRLTRALFTRSDVPASNTSVSQPVAFLAALITAVLWPLATFASLYMAETLFTFLFTAGLVVLVEGPTTSDERRATNDERRRTAARLGVAGVLFGLATLTRSITLAFLPIIALWLFFRTTHNKRWTVNTLCSLLFVLCCCATIAPWTARNYLAYGRPIIVETGLSFNLWFFNEPREDRNTIYETLRDIPNPAERSDYATAKGLERLREDPAILARKLWPNWSALFRVKPIEDRFVQESYYASVGFVQFTAALLLDDLLYVVILLASVVGFTSYKLRVTSYWSKSLVLAWVLYVVVTVLLTHGEARYRQFLFPVLIPYAAAAIVGLHGAKQSGFLWRADGPHRPFFFAIIGGLYALFLATILIAYPWDWARENIGRGWHTLVGDVRAGMGDQRGALQSYQRAVAISGPPDAWLNVARAARTLGEQRLALAAYDEAVDQTAQYIPARVLRGDYERELGEEERARRSFAGRYTDAQAVTDWAWEHLQPRSQTQIDIGNDLDLGYVGGMYPTEELLDATARWTNGHGLLRLTPSEAHNDAAVLHLRLAAPRPNGQAVPVQVCVAERCTPFNVGATWRTYAVPLTATTNTAIIEVRSATFDAPDGRQLGVLVDRAALR